MAVCTKTARTSASERERRESERERGRERETERERERDKKDGDVLGKCADLKTGVGAIVDETSLALQLEINMS